MELEILARKALDKLKQKYGLPKSGFIAGGAIANSIWKLVSGTPAVINDIDVFVFNEKIEVFDEYDRSSLFRYADKDLKYIDTYSGISWNTYTKDFYTIVSADRDGIFNYIKYNSNSDRPELILNSFDINCTKVGYSIDEDKFYFTKEFEEFIKTGKLLVSSTTTPSHTAVRIAKKSKELKVNLDEFELKILCHILTRQFSDQNKKCFKSKYKDMLVDNWDILKDYFVLQRDKQLETYVFTHFNLNEELYYLRPTKMNEHDVLNAFNTGSNIFKDNNIESIYTSKQFMFYIRNIYGNEELTNMWTKLSYFFTDDYVDCEVSDKEVLLLQNFAKYAPSSINTLKGLKLSEQISFINKLLEEFKEDPMIAISLLEKGNVGLDTEFDEQSKLLLELSVRKEIVINPKRADMILNPKVESKEFEDNSKLFDLD
jgi:hypothetical protein